MTDGVIDDPRVCTAAKFNVDALLCSGADAPTCLTAAQVAAVRGHQRREPQRPERARDLRSPCAHATTTEQTAVWLPTVRYRR